jgi:flagellar basal body-associated protein FliL
LCGIHKPQQWGNLGPIWAFAPQNNKNKKKKQKKKKKKKKKKKVSLSVLVLKSVTSLAGFVTFLWIVQYNCYRKFVEKHRRAYEEAIKAMSQYPESVMYHTQGSQDDYSAFSAIVAMNVVAMISAEG